jgi:hypothetical protein
MDLYLTNLAWHDGCIRERHNQKALMNNHQESTYTLLVRSEEKSRGALETFAYVSVFLSVILAVWQFAVPS